MPSHTGHHIYRCAPATRNRAYPGGHVARQAAPVEEFIARLVIARLSRPDAADLVSAPAGGPDVAALREEATAIRAAVTWQSLDLSRQRAVIKTLMTVTLHSPGRGARRAFDPATVEVAWRQ